MQLNISSDYTIRIILYLAITNETTTSKSVSEAMGIPLRYTLKLMRELEKNNFLKSFTGVKGGYCLKRTPDKISLFDILSISEPTMKINRCLESDEYCSREGVGSCKVHNFYSNFQKELEEKLSNVSIQSLMERSHIDCQ
ncbi:MAG: Rrf2 family transcriptional regulator [Bacilli bacterium]